MDKVQFNQQKVLMRKVVKKAKVRVIHQLTRQIQRLNKKSGSAQQVEKNKRRAARLGAEIEAIKKFTADQITAAAVSSEETLEDVCKKPDATAEDRAIARMVNYDVIHSKVDEFKGLVKPDFLLIGKRNKRKLKRELREAMAKKEDEEDSDGEEDEDSDGEDSDGSVDKEKMDSEEDGILEEKVRRDEDEDEGDEYEEDVEDEEESDEEVTFAILNKSKKLLSNETAAKRDKAESKSSISKDKLSVVDRGEVKSVQSTKKPVRTAPTVVAVDQESLPSVRQKPKKSSFFTSARDGDDQDEGISSGDDVKETKSKDLGKKLNKLASEMKMNASIKDFLRTRTAEGKKSLDSVFMGRLSDTKPARKQQQTKNRAGQRQRQRRGKMNDPENKKGGKQQWLGKQKEKAQRKVAAVDQPNVVKSREAAVRMVPGVNCFRNKMYTGKDSEQPKPVEKKTGGEKLHPSWEAKRRKKEQESKIVPFEGKKITFGDD